MDNIVGHRIREERKRLNLTQDELAQKINVSGKSVISNYEQGYSKPDLDTIITLAKLFDCSSDYLLGLSSYTKHDNKKNNDEIELDFRIAANNEDKYGQEPSPELKRFIKEIIKEELNRAKKE
ncbi:helix-turn-helix transcriptional regulator [Desulfosporosinus sp. FKA]|uniref:helix-turn-helix domain-containing protein n=1 Tax=Desulfosporosinus sp. FKA TaxID=1969834 RepID=UPI0015530ABC|nr:helix-turn-helix transcriptional regulator [Desulfosporosinus sp. FKA]